MLKGDCILSKYVYHFFNIILNELSMHILVLTATGNPEANLESTRYFLDNNYQIDKITVLNTKYTHDQGLSQQLKNSLNDLCENRIKIESLDIEYGYEESNMFAIQQKLLEWTAQYTEIDNFLFNVTGGTKLISIALDRVSQLLGVHRAECFYQSRDHKIVWYQRKNGNVAFAMNSNLNLQQRIFSRGYHISKQQLVQEIPYVQLKYAEILINKMRSDFHKGRQFCSFINLLAASAEDQPDLVWKQQNMHAETVDSLAVLAQLTDEHFFSFDVDSHRIRFKDLDALHFMKGGWLEIYTGYIFFKVLMGLNPKAELAINVELIKNQTPNEMDVMFIHHADLYCIECKTSKTMAEGKAQDVLYKLTALQDFGGLKQKQAVVSLYSLQRYNQLRAENSHIKIFQEKDLVDLEALILAWLQPMYEYQLSISL